MRAFAIQDTSLAELEHLMTSVPRFTPRGGGSRILCGFQYKPADVDCKYCTEYGRKGCRVPFCMFVEERIEAGAMTYHDLIVDWLRHIHHQKLKKRIAKVAATSSSLYEDETHKLRMNSVSISENASNRLLAAVFLLTSQPTLWHYANKYARNGSASLPPAVLRYLTPGDFIIYKAARDIFSGRHSITQDDLADETLISSATLRLIVHGQMLAQYGRCILALEGSEGAI